jgi:ribosomal protein S27AE
LQVIHAVSNGDQAYACHNLETGESALVVTTPIKVKAWERWSWRRGRIVQSRRRCSRCGRFMGQARHFHRR